MKIATYNVNGIRSRLPVLLRWLEETCPDIVCLQELKAPQSEFPLEALKTAGYNAIWHGQKSWNGVAILTRNLRSEEISRTLPGDSDDTQSRFLEAAIGEIHIGCLYLPNGNPAPGPKFDYKLEWLDRFVKHTAGLIGSGKPVILTGDFNIIPTEHDVYKPERWVNDALFRIEVREAFQTLLSQGWIDALRTLFPQETLYTYWDYFRSAFSRNAGMRIDHFLLSPGLSKRLINAGVNRDVRGWEKTSDHAPVWIELAE